MNDAGNSKANLAKELKSKRESIFLPERVKLNGLSASFEFSLFVEELVKNIAGNELNNCVLVSAGSFSRRELSPFSDIDLMFVVENEKSAKDEISNFINTAWEHNIEISHTVREITDISKFLIDDLHTFTQFFETRYLIGNKQIYDDWNKELLGSLSPEVKQKLFNELIEDSNYRYSKYGNSPKIIEPNLKFACGGLRDFQLIEWIYILVHGKLLTDDNSKTQAESFIELIKCDLENYSRDFEKLGNSYKFLISIRNLLHIINNKKVDRLEFQEQIKVANIFGYDDQGYRILMKDYFESAGSVYRSLRTLIKLNRRILFNRPPDTMAIHIDSDFMVLDELVIYKHKSNLPFSVMMKAFYYRALYNAHFDDSLRALIIDSIEFVEVDNWSETVYWFRKLLNLKNSVGKTLWIMNELGVLSEFIPEFGELNGFIQHGVYHSYSADEHTLIAISNLEKLNEDKSILGRIFNKIKNREIIYLAILFHDIAKPIDIDGHEILGAELVDTFLRSLGFPLTDVVLIKMLIRNHLLMAQTAFRRDLNSPETLDKFVSHFQTVEELDLLYLLTYADMSAVNPALWTNWKSDLLAELHKKTYNMIEEKRSGEELLLENLIFNPGNIVNESNNLLETVVQEHFESINDVSYTNYFTDKEIATHIEEILKAKQISVLFKKQEHFTTVTIITYDALSLLSRLCGVFLVNDVNIHDAKIFTRKDHIVIDSFNVTEFQTHLPLEEDRFEDLRMDFELMIEGMLQINKEIKKLKNKWWRIEQKFFKKPGKISIKFENTDRYTIIDIHSPDRLGFLYTVTDTLNELGIEIYFAKISTYGDEIVDSFYVLDSLDNKINENYQHFVENELKKAIESLF